MAFIVVMTAVGLAAAVPYKLTLTGKLIASGTLPMPLWQLMALDVAVKTVLFSLLGGVGLFFACRTGLGLPFVEGETGFDFPELRRIALLAVAAGAAAGLLIIALDMGLFQPLLKLRFEQFAAGAQKPPHPPAWQGLLASLYGGFTEEFLLRLFFMTLLIWLGRFLGKDEEGRPALWVFWTANLLAAAVFGLGHLPATAAAGLPMEGLIVVRAVLLNGLGGVLWGWLYWTYGLESAILSHMAADWALHVVFPLVGG